MGLFSLNYTQFNEVREGFVVLLYCPPGLCVNIYKTLGHHREKEKFFEVRQRVNPELKEKQYVQYFCLFLHASVVLSLICSGWDWA